MPDLISLPRTRSGGIQKIFNILDPGVRRDDGESKILRLCESVNFKP